MPLSFNTIFNSQLKRPHCYVKQGLFSLSDLCDTQSIYGLNVYCETSNLNKGNNKLTINIYINVKDANLIAIQIVIISNTC